MSIENILVGLFLSCFYYVIRFYFKNYNINFFFSKKYSSLYKSITQNKDISYLQKKLYIQQLQKQFSISTLENLTVEIMRFLPILITLILSFIYISKVNIDYLDSDGILIDLIKIVILMIAINYYFKKKALNEFLHYFTVVTFSTLIVLLLKLNLLVVIYIFLISFVHPIIYSKLSNEKR